MQAMETIVTVLAVGSVVAAAAYWVYLRAQRQGGLGGRRDLYNVTYTIKGVEKTIPDVPKRLIVKAIRIQKGEEGGDSITFSSNDGMHNKNLNLKLLEEWSYTPVDETKLDANTEEHQLVTEGKPGRFGRRLEQ